MIVWYWPNQEQGIIHTPTEVVLDTTTANMSAQQFPEDASQGGEEEEQEQELEEEIPRTKSPLPILVRKPTEMHLTNKIIGAILLQLPLENLWSSQGEMVPWQPNNNMIPMREEWNQWIEQRLQEIFFEPKTPDHLE